MLAVKYIRVSSTKQLDGDGPERQRDTMAAFANTNHYSIAREFIDDISGTKDSASRPAFSAMLAFCAKHNITVILVEKPDRLSRDMLVGFSLITQCIAAGIDIIDCATGNALTRTDDPYSKFVLQVVLAAAELNKNIFEQHARKARQKIKARTGKCEGRKGYADDPKFPQGPAIIARVVQLSKQGLGPSKIASIMRSENWPTYSGGQWRTSGIKRILQKAGME